MLRPLSTRGRMVLAALLTCAGLMAVLADPRPRNVIGQEIGASETATSQAASSETGDRDESIRAKQNELLADVPEDHPLLPVLKFAVAGLDDLEKIDDYSAVLVKRERVDGVLLPKQYLSVKVRHNPFSVYLYFHTPPSEKGQEAIYVAGKNDGKMLAHTVGIRDRIVGTLALNPRGPLAMTGNRYPITEIGILNLTRRLIEVGRADAQFGECEVKITEGEILAKRPCKLIEAVHPQRRKEFRFHIARIYIDDELRVPVRYEAYTWPDKPGGEPILEEQYSYLNVTLNNGFTDEDFSVKNPKYLFR